MRKGGRQGERENIGAGVREGNKDSQGEVG